MANLSGFVKQLRRERDKVEGQLSALNAALAAFVGVYRSKPTRKTASAKRRKLSAKARAKIAAAQRKRWREWKAKQKSKQKQQ